MRRTSWQALLQMSWKLVLTVKLFCRCGFTRLAEGLRQGKLLLSNDGVPSGSGKMCPHNKDVENKPGCGATNTDTQHWLSVVGVDIFSNHTIWDTTHAWCTRNGWWWWTCWSHEYCWRGRSIRFASVPAPRIDSFWNLVHVYISRCRNSASPPPHPHIERA